jgi:hypothetical protein
MNSKEFGRNDDSLLELARADLNLTSASGDYITVREVDSNDSKGIIVPMKVNKSLDTHQRTK